MNAETVTPADTLQEEYRLTELLIELLKQEQAHLVKADIEGLIAVTAEKSRAAAEMAEVTSLRYQALAKYGYAAREAGMRSWLDASSTHNDAASFWEKLLKLAQSAKTLNNTNGLLISKHMSRNQKALNILRGNHQSGNFYGPNGQSTSNVRSRGLILG